MSEVVAVKWNGVKVFTATRAQEREGLGDKMMAWLRQNPTFTPMDRVVLQSSDSDYHCLSILVFYRADRAD